MLRGVSGGSSSGGALTPTQMAAFNNSTALLLPRWSTALGRVANGTGNAKCLCLGDSTTYGNFSNGTNTGDVVLLSYPTQLAEMLNASGILTQPHSSLGNRDPKDGRWVLGGTWVSPNGLNSVGGPPYQSQSSPTTLSFTPRGPVSQFKMWYMQLSGGGVLSYGVNGATPATVNTNGSSALNSITVNCSLAFNTFNMAWVSGGAVYVVGIEALDTTGGKTWVDLINCGWDGSTTADWADHTNPWSPSTGIATIAPDLTIISLQINDPLNNLSLASYTANLQTIITAAQITGDVILMSANDCNPGPYLSTGLTMPSHAVQVTFWAAMQSLAATNNVPFIDIFTLFGTYAAANTLGIMGDSLHPNGVGYARISKQALNVIGNV